MFTPIVNLTIPARTAEVPVAPRASRSAGRLIAAASFVNLVVALQQTLVVPAVPRLPQLLGTTPVAVSWVVTATLVSGAVATPVFGRLADLHGKRRMMLIALALVMAGSAIAPLGGIVPLTLGRALQGVGSALVPLTMAQMRDSLPPQRISSALAVLSATLGVGGGIGIPLGGAMLQAWGWQSMFVASLALSLISTVLVLKTFPADQPDATGRMDVIGSVLLAAALTVTLAVISQASRWGWGSTATLVGLAIGVALLVLFFRSQLTSSSPVVDVRVSLGGPLLWTNLASLAMGVAMFTNLLYATLALQGPASQGGFGWSSASAGMAMLPNAAAMFVVAPLSARLADRFSPRRVLQIGGVVTALGYLGLRFGSVSAAALIAWTTLVGIGVGIAYAAFPMLVAKHAPLSEMGSANGVNALLRAIGTALASSAVAALSAALAVHEAGRSVISATGLHTVALLGVALGLVTVALGQRAHVAAPR